MTSVVQVQVTRIGNAVRTCPGPSELFSIRWQDVDFDRNYVQVFATKTKSWRDIPINQEFRAKLLSSKGSAQYVCLFDAFRWGRLGSSQ